jgi:hypothetical protein
MPKPRSPIVAGGYVEAGKVIWDSPKLVSAALKAWAGRVIVTIAPEVETRRDRQNRFYWATVVKTIADETGQDTDSIHEHLKMLHNSEWSTITNPATGEMVEQRISKSTAKLSVADFAHYIDLCTIWAAEFLGIVLPEAEPDVTKRGRAA